MNKVGEIPDITGDIQGREFDPLWDKEELEYMDYRIKYAVESGILTAQEIADMIDAMIELSVESEHDKKGFE